MKYIDGYNTIKNMILNGELGKNGTRLISAQELCKKCGISFVNTLKIIKQLKDEMFLVAIDQKLYIANGFARKNSDLRQQIGNSRKIGMLVPSFTNPFFAQITEKTCVLLSSKNYTPLIYYCDAANENDPFALKFFIQNQCEAVFILAPRHISENIDVFNRFPLPFVIVGKVVAGLNTSYVTSENYSMGSLVAKHLITNGYNCFAYVSSKFLNEEKDERMSGFSEGLKRANQPIDKLKTFYFNTFDSTWKYELTNYVESLGKDSKLGIFCYHDLIAFEVYTYLSNAGYKIPQQIGIIGYDNLEISQNHKLTTCSYSYNEIVSKAFDCLIERIEKSDAENKFIKIQTILLTRNSTKLTND